MSYHKHSDKLNSLPFWKNWIFYVLIFSGIILTLMLLRLSGTLETMAKSTIDKTTERTTIELTNFFNPVTKNINLAREWGITEQLNIFDLQNMNQRFIPVLKNFPQITSMLIGRSDGSEYMMLNNDSIWINRSTQNIKDQKKVLKVRWNYNNNNLLKLSENEWTEKKDYDPRKRPWFQLAIQSSNESIPVWTNPYIFATTKDPGITVSVRFKQSSDTSVYVIAYDLKLCDISNFTTRLNISPHGKVFIITDKDQVLGLPGYPGFQSEDSIKKSVLKKIDSLNIRTLNDVYKEWQILNRTKESFSFSSENDDWIACFQPFQLNNKSLLHIGVIVPESDFLGEIKTTRNIIILGFVLLVILSLVLVNNYNQKRKANLLLESKNHQITQQNEEITAQRDEIEAQRNQLAEHNEMLHQANEEIEAQRDLVIKQRDHIEEIHREVSQSIDYATRLQSAILADPAILKENNIEHFVIFKPKDKVSGDFYWWAEIEGKIIISVADCTGHGVPGAFMSMLGISFLREIIIKEYITSPAVILRKLRKEIIKTLKQKGDFGEQKDGMDMTLISIDTKTLQLQFAGANNSAYIVKPPVSQNTPDSYRDEDKGESHASTLLRQAQDKQLSMTTNLTELKADKMPIAIYERMDKFTEHEIQLQKGDIIYMFSDGYADQFGGPRGKKFKYSQFEKLILENSVKSMQEQGIMLNQAIEDWKSKFSCLYEQTDDITVVGIKI